MDEPTERTETTEPAADHPYIRIDWYGGDVGYTMHAMSGGILYAIAGILTHEAEKLLFAQDVQQAQEAQKRSGKGKLVVPFPGRGN